MSRKIELVLEVDDKGSAVVKNFSSTTEEKVKKMSDRSSGWISKIEDRFKKVGGAAVSMGKKFGHLIKKVGQLTLKLMAAAAAAVGFVAALTIKAALKEYTQFESALTNMVKVTEEPLSTIQSKIMELPSAFGSATEMVKGYYAVISAGVTDPAKAMETLKTSAMAAKGSGTDLFGTIEGLTKMMAGYEGKIKSVTEASDILFAMEKEGQTTFAQLIPVIGGVSKVSSDLNIKAQEMAGSMALITQTAGSTSEAATQYKAVLISLMKPTEAMKEAFQNMGYESAQAAIKELGLAGTLQKLKESTGGSAEKMAELFGRQEALIGVSALSAQGFENLKEKITAVEEATGGTDKAFQSWKATLGALWETFKNTIGKQAILIGEKLAPHLKTVLERLEGWLEKMRDPITEEFAYWIEKSADWAAKFWPHAKDAAKYLADWYSGSKDLIATKLEEFINKVVSYTGELNRTLPGFKQRITRCRLTC
jgi:TP901 family phage tail tape measure protein